MPKNALTAGDPDLVAAECLAEQLGLQLHDTPAHVSLSALLTVFRTTALANPHLLLPTVQNAFDCASELLNTAAELGPQVCGAMH